MQVTTTIDSNLCKGCGLCVQVCPCRTISIKEGKAIVTGDHSLNCGHCAAVCPEQAIKVGAIDDEMSRFSGFQVDRTWLPFGEYDTAQLIRLLASRRSCRNFLDSPVEQSALADLVKAGCMAPSGTNCQAWRFTLLPDRQAVVALSIQVKRFYESLNTLAEKFWLRKMLKLIGKPELEHYYRKYYAMVSEGLSEFNSTGADRLFHGAPAAIVVGCSSRASLPAEDALLATQNILLAAHSMGLGSCLIGLAVEPLKRERNLAKMIGIPDDETVYAVIALGHPAEHYKRWTGRQKPVVRIFNG